MWSAEYQQEFKGVKAEQIWRAWEDVQNWPKWDTELDSTTRPAVFAAGGRFELKPKGGRPVNIDITEVTPMKSFTDRATFPLAKMYDYHELSETADGVILKSRISVVGPLGWLWKKIVAQGVASGVPSQMQALVNYAKTK